MSFISLDWVFWIVMTTAIYWAAPLRIRTQVLIGLTAAFLATIDPMSLVWLGSMTASTYVTTRGSRPSGHRTIAAVLPVLAILIGYKVASATSGDDLVTDSLIPLGLSYYALRCIHYAIERFKGNIRDLGPLELVGYLFFLPTLFVGPIHRFPAWRAQRGRTEFDPRLFGEGLERIVTGWVKVTFVANYLVSDLGASWAGDTTTPGGAPELYLRMVRIGVNLYFQFAGYSDIAIGFARLLGFRVVENFDRPFFASNISEFWASWHISLTSWSRDYVYTPVIAKFRSPAAGAIASLLAIALWHEASVRYLVWGLYHGVGIAVWQQWRSLTVTRARFAGTAALVVRLMSVTATVHFVLLGFLLVREPDLATMLDTISIFVTEWR